MFGVCTYISTTPQDKYFPANIPPTAAVLSQPHPGVFYCNAVLQEVIPNPYKVYMLRATKKPHLPWERFRFGEKLTAKTRDARSMVDPMIRVFVSLMTFPQNAKRYSEFIENSCCLDRLVTFVTSLLCGPSAIIHDLTTTTIIAVC